MSYRTAIFCALAAGQVLLGAENLQYQSPYLRIEMAKDQPSFSVLAVDSLGKGKLSVNTAEAPKAASAVFQARRRGDAIEYQSGSQVPWSVAFSPRSLSARSSYIQGAPIQPLVLAFNIDVCHATLLGRMNEDGSVRLPALLHLPDYGSLRITATGASGLSLGYQTSRGRDTAGLAFIRVSLPPADATHPQIEYKLEVAAIYPGGNRIPKDASYDGYRRNFLNIFQINPRQRVLANHSASSPCAFTVFIYSASAVEAPPLAEGLTVLDVLRETLDRYIAGLRAYGMAGSNVLIRYDFLDVYPSLVTASWDYARASQDTAWVRKNYPAIKAWAQKMIEADKDGDGLLEYPLSGNSGSWPVKLTIRPSNWWDTIGFGHKDAYSNAIAYRAFLGVAELARTAGQAQDAELYAGRARKIREVYYATFYNPKTGVLAGWKSADGQLHDYYFLFVNGMAVTYGLVSHDQGNRIWDSLLAKMKQVGYTRFDLGLPGNLIPIRRADSPVLDKRYGGPEKEDGSDGFQIYENGGASGNYAFFTVQALYELGRIKDGDSILLPMLQGFEAGIFQGRAANGLTNDWLAWDGTPHGYEGMLVDNYLTLLCGLTRNGGARFTPNVRLGDKKP
jgi:hypothetical protein